VRPFLQQVHSKDAGGLVGRALARQRRQTTM
jgi:hypothetical protein